MVGIDISPGDPTAKVVADRIRAAYNNRMLTLVGPDRTVLQTDYDFFQQYTLSKCVLNTKLLFKSEPLKLGISQYIKTNFA